jgi:hypothetical protein
MPSKLNFLFIETFHSIASSSCKTLLWLRNCFQTRHLEMSKFMKIAQPSRKGHQKVVLYAYKEVFCPQKLLNFGKCTIDLRLKPGTM